MKKTLIIIFLILIVVSFLPIFTVITYPADAPTEEKGDFWRYLSVKISKSDRMKGDSY